jgi:hypothetical protein
VRVCAGWRETGWSDQIQTCWRLKIALGRWQGRGWKWK